MGTPTITPVHNSPEGTFGRVAAFSMHTVAVYVLALSISPSLVGYGSRFLLSVFPSGLLLFRIANLSLRISADWYLQHLEIITILPALVAGYLVVRGTNSVGTWAWCIPALVLLYRIATYNPPVSVFASSSFLDRLKYFFITQQVVPTLANLSGNPERVAAQMFVTAPFYAGLAYSIAALAAKRRVVQKLLTFEHPQE